MFCSLFICLINSGAPAARRAAKRSPIVIMGKKKKPMKDFPYGYHGKRYCSWARTHDDGVASNQLGFLTVNVVFEIFVSLFTVSPISTYSAKYIDT